MLYYGLSQVGQYHLDAGSDVCQDSFCIEKIADDILVAAVADGVGSESHSEVGSKIAAAECVKYIKDYYDKIDDKIGLLSNSFHKALFSVEDASTDQNIPMDQMDCTLCVVIYTPDCIYTGNVGDSGAIALDKTGNYVQITKQQNDDEGRVYPLVSKYNWIFEKTEGEFVSVLLATDGFYNYMFPKYLSMKEGCSVDDQWSLLDYDSLSLFMDTNNIDLSLDNDQLLNKMVEEVNKIPRTGGLTGINDDITVVGLLSDKKHDINDKYVPIDRANLIKEYNEHIRKLLYPSRKILIGDKRTDYIVSQTILDTPDVKRYALNTSDLAIVFSGRYSEIINEIEENINTISKEKALANINGLEMPVNIVREDGKFCGYVVKEASGYSTLDMILQDVDFELKERLMASKALAKMFNQIHEAGYTLNITNINSMLFDVYGHVVFSDIAFMSHNGDTSIILDQGYEEQYLSPEILMKMSDSLVVKDIQNTTHQDNFILSLMIYKLLVSVESPFIVDGSFKRDNIIGGKYKIECKEKIPAELSEAFDNCFDTTKDYFTFGAKKWLDLLDKLQYAVCKKNRNHIYWKTENECPVCAKALNGNGHVPSQVISVNESKKFVFSTGNEKKLEKVSGKGLVGTLFGAFGISISGKKKSTNDENDTDNKKKDNEQQSCDTKQQKTAETKKVRIDGFGIRDDNNAQIHLDKSLLKNEIYERFDCSSRIAVKYQKELTDADADHLRKLINNTSLINTVEWPCSLLYDNGKVVGYLADKKISDGSIDGLYQSSELMTRKYLIASKLLSVVRDIHLKGYYLGELGPNNVSIKNILKNGKIVDLDVLIVNTNALLIDRIGEKTETRYTTVPEEYLPKKDKDSIVFDDVSDDYQVAQHVFRLLFMGQSPLVDGEYIFASGETKVLGVLSSSSYPKKLMDLFEKTFHKNIDESCDNYYSAIVDFSHNLVECKRNIHHRYFNELEECPYCKIGNVNTDNKEDI